MLIFNNIGARDYRDIRFAGAAAYSIARMTSFVIRTLRKYPMRRETHC
jgi:hypothetical protein